MVAVYFPLSNYILYQFRKRMKERRIEIETAKEKLAKLKSVISWKTLVITKKFNRSSRKQEAEIFARNYKMMAHDNIDKKIQRLNVTKTKVSGKTLL